MRFRLLLISLQLFRDYLVRRHIARQLLASPLREYQPSRPAVIRRDAVRVSVLAGFFLAACRGKRLKRKEVENLILAGAITPVYDSFFDGGEMDTAELEHLSRAGSPAGDSPDVRFFSMLRDLLYDRAADKQLATTAASVMFRAQIDSREQKVRTSLEEIQTISDAKGGSALLFYAAATDTDRQRDDLVYAFGAFVQLVDDVFDVVPDSIAGIITPVNLRMNDLQQVREELTARVAAISVLAAEKTSARREKISTLCRMLLIPALSYLDFLEQHRKSEGEAMPADLTWKGWKRRDYVFLWNYTRARIGN